MSEQQIKIGKKDAGRRIAEKLSEFRRRPPSQKIMNIVSEISEREKNKFKKIAKPPELEPL